MSDRDTAAALTGQVEDAPWRRVHPLTPLIRSWQSIAVVGFFVAQDAIGGGYDAPRPPVPDSVRDLGGRALLAGGGLVLLVVLLVTGLAVLSWRMTRYRLTGQRLEINRGVLFRQQRRAQLDRIQAVDVTQPLLARIFGLARLTVEVAGSGNSKLELSFLTEDQAQQLRNRLLAGAAGLHYDTDQAPQAPEHHWLEVPIGRLVGSIVLSGATVFLAVCGVASLVWVLVVGEFGLAFLFPGLLATAGMVWSRLTRGFGFRVATSPDGLRLRHGLLEQSSQTVPPGRIQAVRLSQPLLWRVKGWWRVDVNVAGYTSSGEDQNGGVGHTLLPVGTRDEVVSVLWFVLPDLGVQGQESAGAVVDAAMTGVGQDHSFVVSPRQARWLDPISWRRNGFRITRTVLLVRRGALRRELVLVPHARTQSLGITQGPLERRLGLATFALHSTPGPIDPQVPHLAVPTAARLLAEQAELARRARAEAGPERWMQAARVSDRSGAPALQDWTFRPLTRLELPLLSRWLADERVHRWWFHDSAVDAVEREFGPGLDGEEPVEYRLALLGGRPVGLAQRYRIADDPQDVALLAPLVHVGPGTWGMDYLIGEPDARGEGRGSAMVAAFTELLWRDHPEVSDVVVPVVAGNRGSWRALERAGYLRVTSGWLPPDNPLDATASDPAAGAGLAWHHVYRLAAPRT